MPFDGNGTFTPSSPEYPAIPGTLIEAADWNAIVEDFAAGLSNTLTRDGQSSMAADLNAGGFRVKNIAASAAATDAVRQNQLFSVTGGDLLSTLHAVTQPPGTQDQTIATTAFVVGQAFVGVLPAQPGNEGKVVTTDGANASWQYAIPTPQAFTGAGPYAMAGTIHKVLLIVANGSVYERADFIITGEGTAGCLLVPQATTILSAVARVLVFAV